jgi:Fe-S cluster assembly iron-binding protein IscA
MIVEKDLLDQFKNFKVDYSDGWFSKGFKITAGIGGSGC